MKRERDARGRFIKKEKSSPVLNEENDSVHQLTRVYNRLADGGEPTLEDVRRECRLQQWSLRALAIIFISFLAWLFLSGCSSPKVVTEYVTIEKKSVETVFVRDTLLEVKLIPAQDSISTKDTSSVLQNAYCISNANIANGILTHTLSTKPNAKASGKVKYIDRVIHDSIPYPVEVPGPTQYIEHDASWLESFFMIMGMIASAMLVAIGIRKLNTFS